MRTTRPVRVFKAIGGARKHKSHADGESLSTDGRKTRAALRFLGRLKGESVHFYSVPDATDRNRLHPVQKTAPHRDRLPVGLCVESRVR
jgi:hypothetical protein